MNGVTPLVKPKLRNYDAYIADMQDWAKKEGDELFKDKGWGVRDLYALVKDSGANLYGLQPVKKDRRKICNRLVKKRLYDATVSYSKAISSGKYAT